MKIKLSPQEETIDEFEAVSIHILAKRNRLCNEGKYGEAQLLEQAYIVIFGADTEQIKQKVIDYYLQ